MKFPADIEILQSQEESPFDELGYRWVEPGYIPYGYDANAGVPKDVAAVWQRMFQQLTFIAEMDDGEAVAMWKYREDLPLERAPIVILDTEGQFDCTARTLSDQLLVNLENEEFDKVREQLIELGITPLASVDAIYASVRLLPDPQMRFEDFSLGTTTTNQPRKAKPTSLRDLLGMAGEDPQVAAFLTTIENPAAAIELKCDGDGLVNTIFLSPETVAGKVEVKGISLGGPVSSLAAFGKPEAEKAAWKRWINDGLVIHTEIEGEQISRITIWSNA